MTNTQTLLQKVWTRVFNEPDSRGLLIRNPKPDEYFIVPSYSPMAMAPTVINAPKFVPINIGQLGSAVASVMALLRARGFQRGDRASIIGWNSAEWVIAHLAVQSMGGVTVPIYPHSTPEQANYVLGDSGAKFLFSTEREQLAKATPGSCQTIFFDDIPELLTGVKATQPFVHHFLSPEHFAQHAALRCASTAELRNFEALVKQTPSCGIARSDLSTVIYTSGSTGAPKGVMLTHGAFASACEGMLGHGFDVDPERDLYVSYLPMAHVYELAAGLNLCLWTGTEFAFCRIEEVGETLKELQPTLQHGVPAVWRKAKEKIDAGIAAKTGLSAKIVAWAFKQNPHTFAGWLADLLVFSRIRAELGGRLRLCTSGGAPISKEIMEFYFSVGIELLQGYGLTETTGAASVNRPTGCALDACNKFGSVGELISEAGLEMRIASVPGQEDSGQGEIQFRGPTVMIGYWNRPEETKKAFTEDGWFRTGDLGRVDGDNFLWITGRLKRLLKTDGGKYVAPEKIEKAFEQSPIVQCIVPVGDAKPFISGLVFVNQPLAKELLAKAGIVLPAVADVAPILAEHELVMSAVQKAVDAANSHLERWEQLKKFRIIPVEATVANGLLTPTLKIRTEEVLKRYPTAIEELYQKPKAS